MSSPSPSGCGSRGGASASNARRTPTGPAKAQVQLAPADQVQKAAGTQSASQSTGESEGAEKGESENGSAAEGDTHEDPPGQDVQHECPPNCDTANGEKP